MQKIIWVSGIILLLVASCGNDSVPEQEIVARVGEQILTRSQLSDWMPPQIPAEQKDVLARQYIEKWIQTTTLFLESRKEDIVLKPYEKWSLQNLEQEMLAEKYLSQKRPRNIIITDEEISTYYEENQEEFVREENEVHLVQLFLENRDQAIAKEISESKSLLDVIQKNYLDKQENILLEKNGDLGYVPENNLRSDIVRSVRSGRTGRIYGPIRISGGYYYFQMMDKQKAGTFRSLDLVRQSIELRLVKIKRMRITEDLAKQVLDKYSVEIFPEHIN